MVPHVLVDDPGHHGRPHPRILQEVGPGSLQRSRPSLDDTYFILFPLAGAVALWTIGGMPYLVWGFFVRSVLVLHATWLVNSATHIWGYRTHETRDNSTNLWWVALVTYGEGWHNNHHAFQTSARHGMRWWEVDTTYMTISPSLQVNICGMVEYGKFYM